jgi:hypothetical protein
LAHFVQIELKAHFSFNPSDIHIQPETNFPPGVKVRSLFQVLIVATSYSESRTPSAMRSFEGGSIIVGMSDWEGLCGLVPCYMNSNML